MVYPRSEEEMTTENPSEITTDDIIPEMEEISEELSLIPSCNLELESPSLPENITEITSSIEPTPEEKLPIPIEQTIEWKISNDPFFKAYFKRP